MVYFHDDWGSQQKSFLKPDTYRDMIVPHLRRLCDEAHKLGILVTLHSCGKIEPLVPLMVEAHVDCWSGQPMNDRLQVLKDNQGKIYVEFGPDVGGFGLAPASDEEKLKKINDWLAIYGDYIDSIFVNTSFGGNQLLYKTIYEYSRKKFNR
jgi:uroporphyrinogen decarboxylase